MESALVRLRHLPKHKRGERRKKKEQRRGLVEGREDHRVADYDNERTREQPAESRNRARFIAEQLRLHLLIERFESRIIN